MPITTLDLDLTNNCVLACDYCFRGAKNPRRLSLETGKAAIDWFIRQSQDQKKISVALFGGEPLMEFELIKQLVPYAKEEAAKVGKNIHFSATTNCVLINDEMIAFFRKYGMTFHTSIDGGPESHDKHRKFPNGKGTSEIVSRNVKKVLKYWPNRTARMTVSNDNISRWIEDTQYLVNLGYKNLAMIPVPEQDWTEEQFEIMKQQLRKISDFYIERYRKGKPIYIKHIDGPMKNIINPSRRKSHCGAGRGYVLVKTDGTIYPCHRFGGDIDAEAKQEWKLGSIYEGWDEEKRNKLLSFDCRKDVKADCENCIAVHTCGTTCIAVSWSCFHDIYKPHPNQCRFTKMYFPEAMRVHYILESEGNPLFMKKYHPERLEKKSGAASKKNASQTKQRQVVPEVMFVMLSNKALSPCYMFNGNHQNGTIKLTAEKLKSIMKWATGGKSSIPNLFFLADDKEKLDPAIARFLENIPEQILVPLVSAAEQEELNIPFSEKQTVIAATLKQLVAEKDNIRGRPVIAHVERYEIDRLADLLLSIKDRIPQITLRLLKADELSDEQIDVYKKQLDLLRDVLRLESTLHLNGIQRLHLNGNKSHTRCPAGRQLVTVGPDGNIYPCPAFFQSRNNGQPIDLIKNSFVQFSALRGNPGCVCGSDKCPGCEYMKLTEPDKNRNLCKVYQAESV